MSDVTLSGPYRLTRETLCQHCKDPISVGEDVCRCTEGAPCEQAVEYYIHWDCVHAFVMAEEAS